MKRKSVAFGIVFLALAVLMTPASGAVSDKTRRACEEAADKVLPALTAPEREAFIANCLANATATKGSK